MRSASVGKKDSNFNFLQEVEEKVLKSPNKNNSKTQSNWSSEKDNLWLSFKAQQKEKKQHVFDKDLFDNFDSCVLSPSKKKKSEKTEKD